MDDRKKVQAVTSRCIDRAFKSSCLVWKPGLRVAYKLSLFATSTFVTLLGDAALVVVVMVVQTPLSPHFPPFFSTPLGSRDHLSRPLKKYIS